jgi:hypothetical protein
MKMNRHKYTALKSGELCLRKITFGNFVQLTDETSVHKRGTKPVDSAEKKCFNIKIRSG